jgi:hypothetical protein
LQSQTCGTLASIAGAEAPLRKRSHGSRKTAQRTPSLIKSFIGIGFFVELG